jgi:type II secretory pathway predicted ATPase ExeA
MESPYLSYFSLKEEPFSTVPSPRYLFLTPVHATALSKAEFVVQTKKGVAAVFGDTGTGKSSLARLLHQKFLDNGLHSALVTNPNYPGPYSLLRTIALELGVPRVARSYADMLLVFKSFLLTEAVKNKKTIILMIDEAQTLRLPLIETLRQLVNFETNDEKLLQIVLFAQEDLRSKLAHPRGRNFRSRIVMASTLDRLAPGDLAQMVDFRWRVASGGQKHPFDPEAIAALYDHSGGTPRDAAILADASLLLAFLEKEKRITAATVKRAAHEREVNLEGQKEAA